MLELGWCGGRLCHRQLASQGLRHQAHVGTTLAAKLHPINLSSAVRAVHRWFSFKRFVGRRDYTPVAPRQFVSN
jgi:hypothetical protein